MLSSPVNVVSYRKQRCPAAFHHVKRRIRRRHGSSAAPAQVGRIAAGQRPRGSWLRGLVVTMITPPGAGPLAMSDLVRAEFRNRNAACRVVKDIGSPPASHITQSVRS